MTPQAAFEVLNRAAGIAPLAAPKFEGGEAVLPTPFCAATAAGVALAFGAAAAAEVWRFRGGERQTVSVDLNAAAASLLSRSLVRLNGAEIPLPPPSPVTGFFQSADRHWLYLHGGSPHLAERTLDLLNAGPARASVMEAVAKWNGRALEDAMAFLNLSGALVHSEEEWNSSVPGRILGAPVVLKKIADSPPSRLSGSTAPLAGFRVLDLTRMIAGPTATRLLASYGAEVLTVVKDRAAAEADVSLSAGKRKTVLDLTKPADAEALRRLARHGDIFVDSFRPGALAELGFSPASLAHIASGTIYVSISAYGADGPWSGRRGWEEVTQAATGLAAEQGAFLASRHRRESQPALLPAPVCGALTGYLAAAGALAAVIRRIREGGSWLVEVSLASSAQWLSSLGRIDAARVPTGLGDLAGLDQYRQSCETHDGRFEYLGPVVRLPLTEPLKGALPDGFDQPVWASAHEEANAAEIQPA